MYRQRRWSGRGWQRGRMTCTWPATSEPLLFPPDASKKPPSPPLRRRLPLPLPLCHRPLTCLSLSTIRTTILWAPSATFTTLRRSCIQRVGRQVEGRCSRCEARASTPCPTQPWPPPHPERLAMSSVASATPRRPLTRRRSPAGARQATCPGGPTIWVRHGQQRGRHQLPSSSGALACSSALCRPLLRASRAMRPLM